MTDSHVSEARRIAPGEAHKIRRLDPQGDVPDPVGGDLDVYGAAGVRIEKALLAALDKGPL